MKRFLSLALFALCFGTMSSPALAQDETELPHVETNAVAAQQIVVSFGQMDELKERLEYSVFVMYAHRPKEFELADSGMEFDGAAVAIKPEAIRDILTPTAMNLPEPKKETQETAQNPGSHSFFSPELVKASSPFYTPEPENMDLQSSRQYFLTTADWLTFSETFEIEIFSQREPAKLEFRDDHQNLAVISAPADPRIKPVEIVKPDEPIPKTVFALLSPGSLFESLTQHELSVLQMHLYGTANLTAKNGYPLFSIDGKCVGLCVGPQNNAKNASIVHPGLIDRALHPQKYTKIIKEEIQLNEIKDSADE